MKYIIISVAAILLSACGDGGSDGDASTYDTCQIQQSSALLATDRARDLSQCWRIQPTEDQRNALSQCKSLVSSYLSRQYVFGHSVEYSVSSSSCP